MLKKKKLFVQFSCSHKAESIDPCKQQDSVVLSNGKQSKTVARSDKCLYEKDAICRMQEFTGYMKRLDENGVMIRKLACIQHTVCFVTCWEQTELKLKKKKKKLHWAPWKVVKYHVFKLILYM